MEIIFVFFGFLFLCEATCLTYLWTHRKKPLPFFINIEHLKKQFTVRKAILSLVMRHYMVHDANLGYRMKANCKPFRMLHKIPGKKKRFKEVKIKNFFEMQTDEHGFIKNTKDQNHDYAALAQDNSIYKILVIGNSVTAGYGTKSGDYTWPAILEEQLNKKINSLSPHFKKVVVINSASLGSGIAQELRRFQDETSFLNPHLVIAFTGGLIEYEYCGNPIDVADHEEQKRMNEYFNYSWLQRQKTLLPNFFTCLQLWFGEDKNDSDRFAYRKHDYLKTTAAQYMIHKIRQIKGLCDANNSEFLFFFQPVMGIGKKPLSKREENLIQHFERYFFEKNWIEYCNVFNAYAYELRTYMTDDYMHDYMDMFEHVEETTYCDPRHQNEHGHKIIASKIEDTIYTTGILIENEYALQSA